MSHFAKAWSASKLVRNVTPEERKKLKSAFVVGWIAYEVLSNKKIAELKESLRLREPI